MSRYYLFSAKMRKQKSRRTRRRSFLKTLGVGCGLGVLPIASAKGGPEAQVELDTSEHDTIDTARLVRERGGDLRIEMAGTVAPTSDARAYTVGFPDDANGSTTRDTTAVDIDTARLTGATPIQRNGDAGAAQRPSSGEVRRSDGSDRITGSDGVGAADHDGGDSESDHEGGAWIVSEDPVNLNVAKTQHWLQWDETAGNVDWADAAGSWTAWEYTVPPSDWNHNDSWFTGYDFGGNTAEITYKVDYINWTWNWNHNKTEAFHRITLVGNPGGDLNWSTTHWHTGEDAGLLNAKAGHYSGWK